MEEKKLLSEDELEKVSGGQMILCDGTYSNGSPGEKYIYLGTCRVCRKQWWSTEVRGTCSCGGGLIWATHK